MRKGSRFGLMTCVGLQCWAYSALADATFSIGIPKGGINKGVVYGFAAGDDAESKSMRYCRGQIKENNDIPENASAAQAACKVIGTYQDECIAFAVSKSTEKAVGFGWAIAKTSERAKERAIAACEERGAGACIVQKYGCDGTAE